jgi:hypothetical protein
VAVEQVIRWRTSGGCMFSTERDALDAEAIDRLEKLIKTEFPCLTASRSVAAALVQNSGRVRSILEPLKRGTHSSS